MNSVAYPQRNVFCVISTATLRGDGFDVKQLYGLVVSCCGISLIDCDVVRRLIKSGRPQTQHPIQSLKLVNEGGIRRSCKIANLIEIDIHSFRRAHAALDDRFDIHNHKSDSPVVERSSGSNGKRALSTSDVIERIYILFIYSHSRCAFPTTHSTSISSHISNASFDNERQIVLMLQEKEFLSPRFFHSRPAPIDRL